MALLNRFVNGSLDLLQEVQGDLADVVFDNLDNLSDSAEKLRKLKQKLEEKLPELREVIYLAKHVSNKIYIIIVTGVWINYVTDSA